MKTKINPPEFPQTFRDQLYIKTIMYTTQSTGNKTSEEKKKHQKKKGDFKESVKLEHMTFSADMSLNHVLEKQTLLLAYRE